MKQGTKARRHEGTKWVPWLSRDAARAMSAREGGIHQSRRPRRALVACAFGLTTAPHVRLPFVALLLVAFTTVFAAPAFAAGDEWFTPPSLDELLGLSQAERDQAARDAEEAARREADEEALRRRLEEGRQAMSHFAQAIEQMIVSADLLDTRFDPGLGTQRVQEDVIAKLTYLIDQASQQSQRSQSRSSSAQREPSRQPQQQPQDPQPGQADRPTDQDGEGDQENVPPGFQQGEVHTEMAETRQEWGALPERIREMLLQGRQERFSSLYEQLTRDYYRRLASE